MIRVGACQTIQNWDAEAYFAKLCLQPHHVWITVTRRVDVQMREGNACERKNSVHPILMYWINIQKPYFEQFVTNASPVPVLSIVGNSTLRWHLVDQTVIRCCRICLWSHIFVHIRTQYRLYPFLPPATFCIYSYTGMNTHTRVQYLRKSKRVNLNEFPHKC